VELTVADHMQKVLKPNFAAAWEEIGDSNELEDTYGLSSMKSVEGLPCFYVLLTSAENVFLFFLQKHC